jgi:hypothetical protein
LRLIVQTPSTTDWEKVARALALLVVRRHFVDRPLVEDAENAAKTAGLTGAAELAKHVTTALKGTRSATRVTVRALAYKSVLVTDPVSVPKRKIIQPAFTKGRGER